MDNAFVNRSKSVYREGVQNSREHPKNTLTQAGESSQKNISPSSSADYGSKKTWKEVPQKYLNCTSFGGQGSGRPAEERRQQTPNRMPSGTTKENYLVIHVNDEKRKKQKDFKC